MKVFGAVLAVAAALSMVAGFCIAVVALWRTDWVLLGRGVAVWLAGCVVFMFAGLALIAGDAK